MSTPTDLPIPSDETATLDSLRQMMRKFVTDRHWEKYHTPKNLAAAASVEASELLELFQWLTPEESAHKPMNEAPFRQAVAEELADVLMYLISLANVLDLDIAQTVAQKMSKNCLRFPPEKFFGHYERALPSAKNHEKENS